MTAYTPDVVVTIESAKGDLRVNLARGGEKFPWAEHKGRIIIGPPDSSSTSDGTPMESLEWKIAPYWVVEAFDTEGEIIELTPEEYGRAIQEAIDKTTEDTYDYGLPSENDSWA